MVPLRGIWPRARDGSSLKDQRGFARAAAAGCGSSPVCAAEAGRARGLRKIQPENDPAGRAGLAPELPRLSALCLFGNQLFHAGAQPRVAGRAEEPGTAKHRQCGFSPGAAVGASFSWFFAHQPCRLGAWHPLRSFLAAQPGCNGVGGIIKRISRFYLFGLGRCFTFSGS